MESNQLLEIFVLPASLGCRTAATLAERMRAAALPGVDVRIVDLSEYLFCEVLFYDLSEEDSEFKGVEQHFSFSPVSKLQLSLPFEHRILP